MLTIPCKLFMSVDWKNLDNGLKELKWDLDSVAGWCCWNKLLINPEKTKFIIFGTRQLFIYFYLQNFDAFDRQFPTELHSIMGRPYV